MNPILAVVYAIACVVFWFCMCVWLHHQLTRLLNHWGRWLSKRWP